MKTIYLKLILVLAAAGLAFWALWPPAEKINLGLDLRGGMQLVLLVHPIEGAGEVPISTLTDRTLEVIRNRVDYLGVAEPILQKVGTDRIMVQLPGVTDPDRALQVLGKTAYLEFALVVEDQELLARAYQDGTPPEGYRLLHRYERDLYGVPRPAESFLIASEPPLTGADLRNARLSFGSAGRPVVDFELSPEGTRKFAALTTASVNRRLAIVLDDVIQSAPVIREPITAGRGEISGQFTTQEASDLALVLQAGALPARVETIDRTVVGPSLGRDSISRGIRSSVLGAILVAGFMVAYYTAGGLVAVFALGLNILLLLGILAYFRATLTLPGIAGIALTVGMAVDANVLIFERIREELRAGRTIGSALDRGYERALKTIIDSNLTTVIAALVLFSLGRGPVKGFGLTLTTGILANIFTAVFVTRLVFDLAIRKFPVKKLRLG